VEFAHSPVLTAFDFLFALINLTLRLSLCSCSRGDIFLVGDLGVRSGIGLGLNNLLSLLGLLSLQLFVLVRINSSGTLVCVISSGHLLSHHLLKRAILSSSLAKLEDFLWFV